MRQLRHMAKWFFNHLDPKAKGAGQKRVVTAVMVVLICFLHRYADRDNVLDFLIFDGSLAAACMGFKIVEKKIKDAPETNTQLPDNVNTT